MLICLVNLPVHVFSQEKRFSFEFTNVPVSTVFLNIEKNSDYSFVYNSQELQKIGLKDYKFENTTVREILETCLKGSDLVYEIRDKHIVIRRANGNEQGKKMVLVRGQVLSVDSVGLPGVTVLIKGTTTGVTTDHKGYYSIFVPSTRKGGLGVFIYGNETTRNSVHGERGNQCNDGRGFKNRGRGCRYRLSKYS